MDEHQVDLQGSDVLPGQKRLPIRADAQIVRLPSNELYRALRAVSLAASTDEARPHLGAVHFAANDELRLTATDGLWLARWTQDAEELPARPAAMLVRLEDVKRLIPLLAVDAKHNNQATINFETRTVDLTDGTILAFERHEHDPPPYDTIWPKGAAEGVALVGFGPALLSRVMKSFIAGGDNSVVVRMQFRGATGAVVVSAQALPELQAIVMPATVSAPGEAA